MRNSCTFKLAGPVTLRRASSKILAEKNKKHIGWGNNMQNIEGDLRAVYVSDGFRPEMLERCAYYLSNNFDTSVFTEEELFTLQVYLQSDQSGAEGKLVAFDTDDKDYRSLFKCGISPHVFVALKLFPEDWKRKIIEFSIPISPKCVDVLRETPIKLLKANPDWSQLSALIKLSDSWSLSERFYYFAKQTVHSFSYGIEWFTFLMNLLEKSGGKVILSREQAEYFLSGIRSFFPEVPERNRRIDEQVRSTGMIFNCHGQPYAIWPGGSPPSYMLSDMKKFYAWGPQSGVAGITQTALTRLQEYIEECNKKWDIVQETHDSYLTQGLLHDTKDRMLKMEECITSQEFTSAFDGEKYRMGCETKIGFNWGGYDKDNPTKNLLGLRVYKPK
jgi:hypothetical protein